MTTPTPPERKFLHSVWIVEINYHRKYETSTETFLFDIDYYEGAYRKWTDLINEDKENGITKEMNDDIKSEPKAIDSWEVSDEPDDYTVSDVNGDYHINIVIYEQLVHQKETK